MPETGAPLPCLLDRILEGSHEYAKELGERLKARVFEQVFPYFARGFIEHAQRAGTTVAEPDPTTSHHAQLTTHQVFQGTLAFLYRLLFVLYAEARDLLPVREVGGYAEQSLKRLKREVAENSGPDIEQVEARLAKAYSKSETTLYDRLSELFAAIDTGRPALNLPTYNGGLFLTDPAEDDHTDEARHGRFLRDHRIPDYYLACGLDLLARDEDPKTKALVFIDYKSLGVRQLGSIYEGLLEFRVRIAPETMAVVKGKKTEEVMPLKEARRQKLALLKAGRGKDAPERTLAKGTVYLENDRRERKATGSYYTPDYIVKYIIEHTVGPVLKEKFEQVTPRLREAQKAYRQRVKNNEAVRKQGKEPLPGHNPELVAQSFRDAVDELFDVKVLDPAMGSGHFLVEAVDFITDKTIDFLNGFPWNPVTATLNQTRDAILGEMCDRGINLNPARLTDINLLKRHVLKRCIYGVDLNPMAVELAKVSLWLDCFTLGAPLSFLDHHLKCGNSVIGAKVAEVRQALGEQRRTTKVKVQESAGKWRVDEREAFQLDLFGSRFAGLLSATEIMRRVGELTDVTPDQVKLSRSEYRRASDALAPFKRILDVYISQWFGNGDAALNFLKADEAEAFITHGPASPTKPNPDREGGASPTTKPVAYAPGPASAAAIALEASRDKRFFHWELEFPEVWYGSGHEKDNPGFDAVVGNPPYGDVLDDEEKLCIAHLVGTRTGGRAEVYADFVGRGLPLLASDRCLSFIVPNTAIDGVQFSAFREHVTDHAVVHAVRDFRERRVFEDAEIASMVAVLREGERDGEYHPSYEFWSGCDQQFVAAELVVQAGSPSPWRITDPVVKRVQARDVGVALVPELGSCHDAGVDYKWKGVGWQKRGERAPLSEVLFYAGQRCHVQDYPVLRGQDLGRYWLSFGSQYLVHDFAKYRTPETSVQVYLDLALVGEKILTRQTADRIEAMVDSEQHVTAKSVHTTLLKAPG